MTSRDRTAEFSNAVRSAASRGAARGVARVPNRVAQGHAEFMFIARAVGKNIAATYTKLEKLTLLAKKRSLFSDRPEEIQELTYIIKEDLSSLNQQIAKLQEVARAQRESREPRGKQLVSHTTSVVFALQSRLAAMSGAFKGVLEARSENLREQKQRRDRFGGAAVSSAPPPGAFSGGAHGDGARLRSAGSVLFRDESAVEMEPLLGRQSQAQQQQMVSYDQTDDYLSSRADTMQSIESTIVELGGIFTQLATMVKEQEEMVERIDSNVADTELNVEAAHGEILKYFQSVTSNRWLMVKVFAVLIFFFIFFVVFLA